MVTSVVVPGMTTFRLAWDASGEGSDPTVVASAVGPNFGNMMQFDGGDRMNLDFSGSTSTTSANSTFDEHWRVRTVSAWFFAPDVTTRQLIYKEGGGVNGAAIYFANGVLRSGIWTGFGDGVGGGSPDMNVLMEAPIKANTWHHVLWTHDGTVDFELYVDGEFIHSPSATEICGVCVFENMADNHTGGDSICENYGNYFLDGLSTNSNDWCQNGFRLDEFVVWSTNPGGAAPEVDASDVATFYGIYDAWLGIWHLDEASGTLTDSGNWGNDSTTESGVTYSQTGQFTNGISVSGTGYFEIASDPSIQFYDQMSTMMWINPTNLPGDATTDHLMIVDSGNVDITFCLERCRLERETLRDH